MPAQRKRVAVAGRQVADAEHADQRFQLVGQCHHYTHVLARQRVARKTRLVMVFDGAHHLVRQAVVFRVVAAHGALQLRKLAHHVGQQIGLGQQRGRIDTRQQVVLGQRAVVRLQRRVVVRQGIEQPDGNGLGNGAHALDALALGAQPVVVDHPGQAFDTRQQRFLAVLVKEELGIRQARADHALVAANHQAGILGRDVADHQKPVRQPALGVQQRKVLLVGLHGQDQALLRHAQKFLFKFAHQHIGPLDQRGHLVQQRRVVNGAGALAHFGSGGLQLARNLGAALGERGNHRAFVPQLCGVAVGAVQHHRVHGGFKTVAVRGVASVQAQRGDRHHAAAMQRHQPVRRAHKAHAAPAGHVAAGGQLVAHHFGDGQLGQCFVQRLLQAFGQRGTACGAVVEQGVGLAIGRALQRGHGAGRVAHVGADGSKFFQQRGCGIAGSVQAHRHRHELVRLRPVGRLRRHRRDVRGQPARRSVGGQLRAGSRQTLGLQLRQQHAAKGVAQFLQHLGRQFFDKQFNKKVLGGHRGLGSQAV